MNYFEPSLVKEAMAQTFAFIKLEESENVLTLSLSRSEKKNALHPQMINEIAFAMQYAKSASLVWVVVIRAEGNVFCAGADLKAFMGMVGTFESSVPEPKEEILFAELFQRVHKPVIAKIEGDVYAGGFLFLAGSTYVLANEDVKFGLPEVKRGLYPFQVMAALLKVMPRRKVIDWCIRGYNLEVTAAADLGLVTHITTSESIDEVADQIISELKNNSPSAIRLGLEALASIEASASEHKYLMEMLQKTIMTKDGQEGIAAFREKRKAVWTGA